MEINKIYNEDCLETMKNMHDCFVDLVIKISVDNERPAHAQDYCRRHGHGERSRRVVRRDLLEIRHLHYIGPIESRGFQTRPQHIVGGGFGIVDDVKCRSVNIHYSVHLFLINVDQTLL